MNRNKIFSLLLIGFLPITLVGQKVSKELITLLSKGYSSKDSANYYFSKSKKFIQSTNDSAFYFYFKIYEKKLKKQGDSAQYYTSLSLKKFNRVKNYGYLRKIHHQLYSDYLDSGQYDHALKEIQLALSYAKKNKDTLNESLHLSDLSILYHDYNFFKKGVAYGKKAYKTANLVSHKIYKYQFMANNAIAINFDDWNKPDSAIFYHQKNLALKNKIKDTIRYLGITYNNIANTYLKTKRYTEAKKYLKKSLNINLKKNKDYNLSTNYNNLATIATQENQNKLALNYFKKAIYYAEKSQSIEKIRDVKKQQYEFYKRIKNYKTALKIQDEYYQLHDSVFNQKRDKKIADLEVKYESSKKEKEIAIQKEQLLEQQLAIKNRNLYTIILGSSLLILAILSFGYYKKSQFKRQQLQKEMTLKDALATIKTQNKLQEQRLRISRDLHDNIGSQLSFIISSIDNLKFVSNDASEKLKTKLSSISSFTSETIFQLRDTIWAMNKNQISSDNLHTRMLSFLEKAKTATTNTAFNVANTIEKPIVFSSVAGINIFRVVQEAINNAVKYANATEINIETVLDQNTFKITITDNGIGFDINSVQLGNGLSNMEKRMSEIDGKIFILSEIKKGTTVRLELNT